MSSEINFGVAIIGSSELTVLWTKALACEGLSEIEMLS